jgi:hypothetical protein
MVDGIPERAEPRNNPIAPAGRLTVPRDKSSDSADGRPLDIKLNLERSSAADRVLPDIGPSERRSVDTASAVSNGDEPYFGYSLNSLSVKFPTHKLECRR